MLWLFHVVREMMARCRPRCLLTSSLTFLFIAVILLDKQYAHAGTQAPVEETTSSTTTTTTAEPFLKSTMFIGLAAGIGGFFAFMILCCVTWKCFCGDKMD